MDSTGGLRSGEAVKGVPVKQNRMCALELANIYRKQLESQVVFKL